MSNLKFDKTTLDLYVRKFVEDERLFAAIDAYSQGYGNMYDLARKSQISDEMFKGLEADNFCQLIHEICDRIDNGTLTVSKEIKEKYRDFYSGEKLAF